MEESRKLKQRHLNEILPVRRDELLNNDSIIIGPENSLFEIDRENRFWLKFIQFDFIV